MAGITTDANEAPSALADGAEARGSEKERAALAKRAVSAIPKETHSSADRRTRVCGKQQHNNQTIPVAAGKAVGTPVKVLRFSGFAAEVLCLRVVPTVGIAVGT